MPRGILFHGPPGTGKTLAAKAVANESGAAFYAQSASAFVEMFAGLGAARIRKLFEEARENAPSIIFIDELDAVGRARTGNSFNREQDQTLNQLLVELDGFGPRDQVIVMGASNRLQDLDPALLRPGRFDRQILIQPPDLKGRGDILLVHTRGKPLTADIDLDSVARRTAGLTGADLANICNEAAISAGRREADEITQDDFEHAMDRVIAGLQQRRVITPKEKMILAYHEAGHAMMAHLMSAVSPVQKATIIARGTALGYTLNLPEEERYLHTKDELFDWMVVTLAGRAAEQVVFGRVTNGAANDLEKVTELARAMVFEYGMSDVATARTMRADNYALSEETKRMRDSEQARLTDEAYAEALRSHGQAPASPRPGRGGAAREGDALARRAARALRRRRERVGGGRRGGCSAGRGEPRRSAAELAVVQRVRRRLQGDRLIPRRELDHARAVVLAGRQLERVGGPGGGDVEDAAVLRVVDRDRGLPVDRRRVALRERSVRREDLVDQRVDVR